jgi:excisionase family DNA binding protein
VNSIVLSIAQVCDLMGCKRSKVFELLADGVLERAPRYGRSLRIYTDSVHKALARPEPARRRSKRARRVEVERINPADVIF